MTWCERCAWDYGDLDHCPRCRSREITAEVDLIKRRIETIDDRIQAEQGEKRDPPRHSASPRYGFEREGLNGVNTIARRVDFGQRQAPSASWRS